MSTVEVPRVMTPKEAAEVSGLPAETLAHLVKTKGHPFTPLRPGGRPGKRCGKGYGWGLTAEQLAAIVAAAQERFTPKPDESGASTPRAAVQRWTPPGGKSRLARKRTGGQG